MMPGTRRFQLELKSYVRRLSRHTNYTSTVVRHKDAVEPNLWVRVCLTGIEKRHFALYYLSWLLDSTSPLSLVIQELSS